MLISSPEEQTLAAFSPDGRWLAYTSAKRGKLRHIYVSYVSPYPGLHIKWQVSDGEGGVQPMWSPDSKELFYLAGDPAFSRKVVNRIMVVPIHTQPTFSAGAPKVFLEGPYTGPWGVSPDGQRVLMLEIKEAIPKRQIYVVLNWFEELKHLAPADSRPTDPSDW